MNKPHPDSNDDSSPSLSDPHAEWATPELLSFEQIQNRRVALQAASENYNALQPHQVIEVAASYANWLDTGQVEPEQGLGGSDR